MQLWPTGTHAACSPPTHLRTHAKQLRSVISRTFFSRCSFVTQLLMFIVTIFLHTLWSTTDSSEGPPLVWLLGWWPHTTSSAHSAITWQVLLSYSWAGTSVTLTLPAPLNTHTSELSLLIRFFVLISIFFSLSAFKYHHNFWEFSTCSVEQPSAVFCRQTAGSSSIYMAWLQ